MRTAPKDKFLIVTAVVAAVLWGYYLKTDSAVLLALAAAVSLVFCGVLLASQLAYAWTAQPSGQRVSTSRSPAARGERPESPPPWLFNALGYVGGGTFAPQAAAGGGLSAGQAFGLSQDGSWIVAQLPAEQFQSPYSLLLIQCSRGDEIIGQRLMPLLLNRDQTAFENRLPAEDLRPSDSTAPLMAEPVSDVPRLLQRMRRDAALAEVDRLLGTQYVRLRPDLEEKVQQLKLDLEATSDAEEIH